MLKLTCREGFVLRQSRLHSGLAQVFLVLFALLAILAPTLDAPLSGHEADEYVSAPADTRDGAAPLAGSLLGAAEDLEDEEDPGDQEEAALPAFATLTCVADDEYRATAAWLPSFPRISGHSCTGPPTL